eukprot:c5914_g1_i1.p1 GENE.c5914_g1_i1~~c5914_g1_i1.p1  ORF type:complete len:410 (+),score=137.63 c5914_g1_i1:118-1230(+)
MDNLPLRDEQTYLIDVLKKLATEIKQQQIESEALRTELSEQKDIIRAVLELLESQFPECSQIKLSTNVMNSSSFEIKAGIERFRQKISNRHDASKQLEDIMNLLPTIEQESQQKDQKIRELQEQLDELNGLMENAIQEHDGTINEYNAQAKEMLGMVTGTLGKPLATDLVLDGRQHMDFTQLYAALGELCSKFLEKQQVLSTMHQSFMSSIKELEPVVLEQSKSRNRLTQMMVRLATVAPNSGISDVSALDQLGDEELWRLFQNMIDDICTTQMNRTSTVSSLTATQITEMKRNSTNLEQPMMSQEMQRNSISLQQQQQQEMKRNSTTFNRNSNTHKHITTTTTIRTVKSGSDVPRKEVGTIRVVGTRKL